MGNLPIKSTNTSHRAFTRLELVVVLACICLLGILALPLLGRSHIVGTEAACMNNLRNLGRTMLIYADQTKGYVPQEGNIASLIFDPVNRDAWYNAAVQPEYPAMTNLYSASAYPLPGNGTIYSCPAATVPAPPNKAFAFFMYGENNWMCVNGGTILTYGQSVQSKFSTMPRPAATIMMGEVDYGGTSSQPADSGVTSQYTAARHDGLGLFSMCDGSVRAFDPNQFNHSGASISAAAEWYINGTDASNGLTSWPCYWWPSATTPR